MNPYTTTESFGIMYAENYAGGSMPCLHTHNTYEIYYLHEGKRNYIINNKVYELNKDCFALIPPNVFHKTMGDKYKRTLIFFSYAFLENFFKEKAIKNMLSCFSSPIIRLPENERNYFADLCRRMTEYSSDCGYDERPLLVADILTLLNKYKQNKEYEPADASSRLLSEILDYIGQNFKSIENLDDIAQKFFITKFHLCRIFKENTGMSVFQYINTLKIQMACTMLTNPGFSMTDISSECGFNSQMYFCEIFHRQLGMTPSQYRKNTKSDEK